MKKDDLVTNSISIKDIDLPCPSLNNNNKTNTIVDWFINWIEGAVKSNKIKHNDILPSKEEFAYMLGVSKGTVQNAIRVVEDRGYLVSKQKVGTLINLEGESGVKKLTSKRDYTLDLIKKYIKENNLQVGDVMISARKLAKQLELPLNTVRSAFQGLVAEKILEKNDKQEFKILNIDFELSDSVVETLVDKVKGEIEEYIIKNCKISDKIPTNQQFANDLQVGLKTVNDAINLLVEAGVLVALRGKYGTIVAKLPTVENKFEPLRETSIFAPASQTAYYYYEKTQRKIKQMIAEGYYPGSKLPPILELAKQLELSPNTIRRAIKELTKEGILTSTPGRWGGTFVIARPEEEEPSYQWLALCEDYVSATEN